MSKVLLSLLLLPWQAFACGAGPTELKSLVTNVPFNVNGSTFGSKTFEIHRETFGVSFADPDGQAIYFNGKNEICLDAPQDKVSACGDELKKLLAGNVVKLKRRDKVIGELEFDFTRGQVIIWSVDESGKADKNGLNYLRITGSSKEDSRFLYLDVVDPRAGKQVGAMTVRRDLPKQVNRCFQLPDPDEFLAGQSYVVDNLTGSNVIFLNGKVTSERYTESAGKSLGGAAGTN
jgi:hypothetical protein